MGVKCLCRNLPPPLQGKKGSSSLFSKSLSLFFLLVYLRLVHLHQLDRWCHSKYFPGSLLFYVLPTPVLRISFSMLNIFYVFFLCYRTVRSKLNIRYTC